MQIWERLLDKNWKRQLVLFCYQECSRFAKVPDYNKLMIHNWKINTQTELFIWKVMALSQTGIQILTFANEEGIHSKSCSE